MIETIKDEGYAFGKICSICHSEKIFLKEEKHLFGLFSRNNLICSQCGAVFKEFKMKWKLSEINNKNNPIWKKYGEQILFAREWERVGNGGLSDEEQRIRDEELQAAKIKYWTERIKSGGLKVKTIRTESPIILHKDEETICVLPNIYLNEARAVRVSRGGYGGTSFRVAKGVSLRLGQFGSQSESHPEIRKIDQGTLVITNKRFVYCGSIKTVDIALSKIVQIDPFDDGINLHKENREKTQIFTWTNYDSLEHAISIGSKFLARKEQNKINKNGLNANGKIEVEDQGKKYVIPLTGGILKSIIEGAVKNTS
jgi:hypothetical protein